MTTVWQHFFETYNSRVNIQPELDKLDSEVYSKLDQLVCHTNPASKAYAHLDILDKGGIPFHIRPDWHQRASGVVSQPAVLIWFGITTTENADLGASNAHIPSTTELSTQGSVELYASKQTLKEQIMKEVLKTNGSLENKQEGG
ncbi:hypothetical protein F4780DRAFT_783095 [Xylariomycetidae sp. FL0641]|nr:hypothetical protein F4780DRAFT_783095 [Xylariomycetidae sp. FL0641]